MDQQQVEQWINERVQAQVQAQVEAQVQAKMEAFLQAQTLAQGEARRALPVVALPKPPHPDAYKGERDAVRINTWIDQLRAYGEFYKLEGVVQVEMAVFYLSGTARDWWANMDVGLKASLTSWDAFCHALKGSFYPIDHERRIMDQIERLRQVGPVHRYVERFELLRTQVAGVSDAMWARYFVNGLSPSVRIEAIRYQMDNPHAPLPELYRRLTAIGDALWRAQATGPRDDPMELSAMVTTKAKDKFRAKAKAAFGRVSSREVTCYGCGEKGHIKRECPHAHKIRPAHLNAASAEVKSEDEGTADF